MTRDPESRSTPNGKTVCTFNVAVNNKYKKDAEPQFFRVSAWNKTGENCQKFVKQGSKVAVTGAVRLNIFTRSDGQTGANIEVDADEVEFLSTKAETTASRPAEPEPTFTDVSDAVGDDLPF